MLNRPLAPGNWSTYKFWQFSHTGTVPGISGPVDLDAMSIINGTGSNNGTLNTMMPRSNIDYLAGNLQQPPPEMVPPPPQPISFPPNQNSVNGTQIVAAAIAAAFGIPAPNGQPEMLPDTIGNAATNTNTTDASSDDAGGDGLLDMMPIDVIGSEKNGQSSGEQPNQIGVDVPPAVAIVNGSDNVVVEDLLDGGNGCNGFKDAGACCAACNMYYKNK